MGKIIPLFGPKYRYPVEKENMYKCIAFKCPRFSFGTCSVPKCKLIKGGNNGKPNF